MCCKAVAQRPETPAKQHGAGSVPVVLLLLIAATLVLAYANRALIYEIRSAANQVRTSLALEAAQAGLAWGSAALSSHRSINAACTSDSAASSAFVDRYLPLDTASPTGRRLATTARPGCIYLPTSGWQCACPDTGVAGLSPPSPASDAPAPAFLLRFADGPRAGTAWLHSQGCSSAQPPCANSGPPSDASRQLSNLLGLLPALARPPYATVTSLGPLQAEGDVQISHDPTSPGWTLASSSTVSVDSTVRLSTTPGQPGSTSVVNLDPRGLNADGSPLSAERWWALHFALSRSAYRTLPHVHVLACGLTCSSSEVQAALDAGERVLWAEGDLRLDSTATYGSLANPVLLIAQGTLRLTAPITLHGYAHAGAIDWQVSGAAPGQLQGALNSASTLHLAGPLRLHRNAAVLARLQQALGSWVPAPGSWSDLAD